MKMTAILFFAACLQVSASGRAQTVTLHEKNVSLRQVFRDISRQTGIDFFYNDDLLQGARKVTLDVTDAPLQEVLEQCFKDQPLTFTVQDKAIIVRQRPTLPLPPPMPIPQPPGEIHGHVTDSTGAPLAGATIRIKGTKKGVSTDSKGNFVLPASDAQAVIMVSFTSYETQEFRLRGQGEINIRLKYSTDPLDEVHVIAYGTTTQRFNVGSISKVTSEEIASQPVTNVLEALEGRVPGLVVTQSSGVPGASLSVQIRGNTAIGGSSSGPVLPSSPLFIIDGVPFAPQNANINQFNSLATPNLNTNNLFQPGLSPFSTINPADVESIEVLKDAEATSIYGSRGANGVVLITTKRGVAGKTTFGVTVNSGQNSVDRTMKMMTTPEYLAMRHEAYNNDGLVPSLSNQGYDLTLFDTTKNTDWMKEFFGGMAHNTDLNAYVTGGDRKTTFLIGSGYHHENYLTPGGFTYDRASFNVNVHHVSTDQRLVLDLTSFYSYDVNNSSGNPTTLEAFTLAPDFPDLFNPDGSLVWNYKGLDLGKVHGLTNNPLAYLKEKYVATNYNFNSNLQIGYTILPGLTLKSSFGYSTLNGKELSEDPIAAQDPARNPSASSRFGTNEYESWIIEPQLTYSRGLLGGKFNFLAGATFQDNINYSTYIEGNGYTNDNLLGSVSAAGATSASDHQAIDKYNAVFGRLGYIWQDKYILSLSGRRDGSSRFGPGKQFGDFGSVAGGWIFSQEHFFQKTLSGISWGKLRVSYGTTGSDNIGDYQYQPNWTPISSSSAYQGIRGYIPLNLANPDYAWEVDKKLEGGLELGFLKDRILAIIDVYRNRCGNQLINYQMPNQTGFSTIVQNSPALVQNTGIEIAINSTNIKTANFSWRTGLNVTIPRSRLVAFPGLATSPYAIQYVIGKPLSVLHTYKCIGVNDTTGVFEFATAKGVPTYSPQIADLFVGGNLDPKIFGGLNNSFSYKGFQLDIFASFTKQLGRNYLGSLYNTSAPGAPNYNLPEFVINSHWQKPGDKATIERYTTNYSQAYTEGQQFVGSSGTYSDASFIRIKTVALTYTLPAKHLKKAGITGCSVYLHAQNLFTISGYKGDPETQNIFALPPLKTVTAGLKLTL